MKVQQAQIELSNARAQADQGLGIERLSRVQENQALAEERKAAAIKDEEIGLLNLVKALKEIDSVDIAQIEKLLSFDLTVLFEVYFFSFVRLLIDYTNSKVRIYIYK